MCSWGLRGNEACRLHSVDAVLVVIDLSQSCCLQFRLFNRGKHLHYRYRVAGVVSIDRKIKTNDGEDVWVARMWRIHAHQLSQDASVDLFHRSNLRLSGGVGGRQNLPYPFYQKSDWVRVAGDTSAWNGFERHGLQPEHSPRRR
jgi:hypothetical protein